MVYYGSNIRPRRQSLLVPLNILYTIFKKVNTSYPQVGMVIFLFEAFRGSAISWCGSAIEEIPIEHVEIVVIKG